MYEEDYDFSLMRENYNNRLLATSSYSNSGNDYRRVSISGDRGKNVNYDGLCYPLLAPKKEFWNIWHNNIGIISEEDNLKYYVEEYYNQVLSNIDLDSLENFLFSYDDRILVCYEEPTHFCHRHIVSSWIKILYGTYIPEVKLIDGKFIEIEKYQTDNIEIILENIMKRKTKDMKGFHSLMALRLFNKSLELDEYANKLENISGKDYSNMHMTACGLRVQADDAEQEYIEKHHSRTMKK